MPDSIPDRRLDDLPARYLDQETQAGKIVFGEFLPFTLTDDEKTPMVGVKDPID
jgi:hypothetical protein